MICCLWICDNPECRWVHVAAYAIDDRAKAVETDDKKITLTYRRGADLETFPPPRGRFSASVNVDSGELAHISNVSAEEDERLLECFRRQLDGPVHEVLRKRWRRARNKTDRTGWRRDDWTWWEPGAMIPWAKVFPDEPDFLVSRRQHEYWAIDSYCVDPECDCHEVAVSFVQQGSGKMEEDVGAIRVDLDAWQLTEVLPAAGSAKLLRQLWKVLVKRPGFRKEVRRRERELKKVGGELPRIRLSQAARAGSRPRHRTE
jgi:hypothetical protein